MKQTACTELKNGANVSFVSTKGDLKKLEFPQLKKFFYSPSAFSGSVVLIYAITDHFLI